MKKVKLLITALFIAGITFAQDANQSEKDLVLIKSIKENGKALELELTDKTVTLHKKDHIQIYLPAQQDFLFVQKKKSLLNSKLMGGLADIAGAGALGVAMNTNNISTAYKALDVMNKANSIAHTADAINNIQNLNISSNAKKIAGKEAEILKWSVKDDSHILIVKIGKKKYEVYLKNAVLTNEVKLM